MTGFDGHAIPAIPKQRVRPMRVVVIGGGISGLTAAYLARIEGHDVVCIDAAAVPGGLVRSERHAGYLCERGPQAVLDDAPDTAALIASLDLTARVLRAAPEAARRFIFARGVLHPLPMNPPALLRSRLLSWPGKMRLLAEPFVRRRRSAGQGDADDGDADDAETVAAFGARRLGQEAGRTLLDTAVIGVYATDANQLSVAAALPRLAAMEREHGSLFRAMLAARKSGKRRGAPVSFPEGLGELTAALSRRLGGGLWRGRAVSLEPGATGSWRVSLSNVVDDDGDGDGHGHGHGDRSYGGATGATALPPTIEADAVVVATGSNAAAALLAPLLPEASRTLASLAAAPVALCCLGFGGSSVDAIGMDLAAYGFLVARGEQPRMLGCQYESSIFPGRAPPGAVLLRAILGGAGRGFEPDIVDKTDDQIAARSLSDLRVVAGLRRDPDLVRVWKYPRGIPIYGPGHAARVGAIDAALAHTPGLFVLGHALRGVGVNESVRAATTLVRERLASQPP